MRVVLKGGRRCAESIPPELADRLIAWIDERRAGPDSCSSTPVDRIVRTTMSEMFTRIGSRTHQFRHVLTGIAQRHAGVDVQQRAALLTT